MSRSSGSWSTSTAQRRSTPRSRPCSLRLLWTRRAGRSTSGTTAGSLRLPAQPGTAPCRGGSEEPRPPRSPPPTPSRGTSWTSHRRSSLSGRYDEGRGPEAARKRTRPAKVSWSRTCSTDGARCTTSTSTRATRPVKRYATVMATSRSTSPTARPRPTRSTRSSLATRSCSARSTSRSTKATTASPTPCSGCQPA